MRLHSGVTMRLPGKRKSRTRKRVLRSGRRKKRSSRKNKRKSRHKTVAAKQHAATTVTPAARREGNSDTTIAGTTLEVIQVYKPEIKPAPKPEYYPTLPPVDTTTPKLTYEVPQQTLYYTYHAQPLRPLALGRDTTLLAYQNYVKLGGGNVSTLYGDAGYAWQHGETGIALHAHHISQKGSMEGQQAAMSGLEGDGWLPNSWGMLHVNAAAERNQYHYYGYDHDLYHYNTDTLKQRFYSFKAGVDLQNIPEELGGWNVHPSLTGSYYRDKFGASERTFTVGTPISLMLDTSTSFDAGINGTFTQLSRDSGDVNNNLASIYGGVTYGRGRKLHGYGHIGTYWGKGNKFRFLFNGLVAYTVSPNFEVNIGTKSVVVQNTYEELTTRNPFLYNQYTTEQTQHTETFGGLQGNINKHFSIYGRASLNIYHDLPMFINTPGDGKTFALLYDSLVVSTAINVGARYEVGQLIAFGVDGTFTIFNKKSFDHVYEEPTARVRGDFMIKPITGLTLTAYLTVLDGMYAYVPGGTDIKQKATFDLGGSAEYQIVPRLSVFATVTNLLNQQNPRWYGYQQFGTNLYGGIRFRF